MRIAQCHAGLAILGPIPNNVESYPAKMFEYLGLGIPVIVSNFSLFQDVVERYQCGLRVLIKIQHRTPSDDFFLPK